MLNLSFGLCICFYYGICRADLSDSYIETHEMQCMMLSNIVSANDITV